MLIILKLLLALSFVVGLGIESLSAAAKRPVKEAKDLDSDREFEALVSDADRLPVEGNPVQFRRLARGGRVVTCSDWYAPEGPRVSALPVSLTAPGINARDFSLSVMVARLRELRGF
jgi:hypothetical protein